MLVVVMWLTVAGGALLATLWVAFGGGRAVGPDDELVPAAGAPLRRDEQRVTSLGTAQVGIHGLVGILTASLVTYAAARGSDRTDGYLAALVALAITAVPGVFMFTKWRTGRSVDGLRASTRRQRVEDRLPRPLVYLHGLGALTTVTLVVILLVVE